PATFAHALSQTLPLLGRHLFPPLVHTTAAAAANIGAFGTVESISAEQDPAERQQSKRLPEGNLAPAEKWRQQPIPQLPYDFAADGDEEQERGDSQRRQKNPFPSHVQFLMPSSIRHKCVASARADAAPHSVCGRAAYSRS